MKVKLATQALSHTVGAAICTLASAGIMPEIATQTAEFIIQMDQLFDSFNSNSVHAKKKLQCAVTKHSEHVKFWKSMKEFVSSWKFVNAQGKTIHTHCKKGWLINLQAAIEFSTEVWHDQPFILMRRVNQDVLENTFSVVRAKRGHDMDPDCLQLITCLRAVSVNNLLHTSTTSNCEADTDEILSTLSRKQTPCEGNELSNLFDDEDDQLFTSVEDFTSAGNSSVVNLGNSSGITIDSMQNSLIGQEISVDDPLPVTSVCAPKHPSDCQSLEPVPIVDFAAENALYYIAGYIAFKTLAKVDKCIHCELSLCESSFDRTLDKRALFLNFKEYSDEKQSLKTPSPFLYSCVQEMSKALSHDDLKRTPLVKALVEKLLFQTKFDKLYVHKEHEGVVNTHIALLFARIFVFSYIRKSNQKFKILGAQKILKYPKLPSNKVSKSM